jgi:hypothetical protein
MAILAIFTGEGITSEMYDALREEVGWERMYPKGVISHAAAFDEHGNAHVVDVWESPEALDEFVNTRLGPAIQMLGIPQPIVEVYPLYNLNAFAGIQRHLLK